MKAALFHRLCRFFGDISYPLYITHSPLIYVYTTWGHRTHASPGHGFAAGLALLLTSVTLAYACLKL